MNDYKELFLKAIERTNKINLSPAIPQLWDGALLTSDAINGFPRAIAREFGLYKPDELDAKCIAIHFDMMPLIAQYFSTTPILTIGYLKVKEETLFKFTEEDVSQLLTEGIKKTKMDIHVWLTLPTMEIIDLTLMTTLALRWKNKSDLGGIVIKHPKDLKNDLEYIPILVGAGYLIKIGAIKMN